MYPSGALHLLAFSFLTSEPSCLRWRACVRASEGVMELVCEPASCWPSSLGAGHGARAHSSEIVQVPGGGIRPPSEGNAMRRLRTPPHPWGGMVVCTKDDQHHWAKVWEESYVVNTGATSSAGRNDGGARSESRSWRRLLSYWLAVVGL